MSSGNGTIVAVDAGTSAVKAALVAMDGSVVAVERRSIQAASGLGVDQSAYWDAVASAILPLTGAGHTIDGIAVAGQGDGLWTLGPDGTPAGPAYEWNSAIAADIVTGWEDDGTVDAHYRASGTVLWPGTTSALWRWLQANEPDHAARVTNVFWAKDWINYQLCGAVATDVTDATIPFLDPRTGSYDAEAFHLQGCEALVDRTAPVVPAGTEIGRVSPQASAATGLAEGTPVYMGCIDVAAVIRGAGLSDVGDALAVLGTTAAALVLAGTLDTGGEAVGATLRLHGPDRYLRVLGASSGTSTIDWYCQAVGCSIDELWSDVQQGKPGVFHLPYLAGERAPFLAPDATGTFLGVTPSTGRPELARAVVHGVTYALRHCLDAGLGNTVTDRPIVLTGGGSASTQWCQLVADVTQRPVRVDDRPHVACAGLASLVTGEPVSAENLNTVAPTKDHTDEYRAFVDLGQQLRPVWSSMRQQLPQETP